MIVLDTNVLSEALRPAPDARFRAWFSGQPASTLFTTAISQAEMLYGLALLPHGRRRQALDAAIAAIFENEFPERVLPFDSPAAQAFATIMSRRRRAGKPMSQIDAQIAAIAASRGAAIATRNVQDFSDCGVALVNPWDA